MGRARQASDAPGRTRQPRAHKLLQALERAGGTLTTSELAEATGIPRKQIAYDCTRLVARRFIERVATGRFRNTAAGSRLARAGGIVKCGPCRPHTGRRKAPPGLRTRAWRAMALLEKFSVPDLVELAAKGTEANAENNLQRYLRILERAGYVRRLRAREPGTKPTSNGFLRYMRLKHTGPQAPVLSERKKTLYDPNTRETIKLGGGHE